MAIGTLPESIALAQQHRRIDAALPVEMIGHLDPQADTGRTLRQLDKPRLQARHLILGTARRAALQCQPAVDPYPAGGFEIVEIQRQRHVAERQQQAGRKLDTAEACLTPGHRPAALPGEGQTHPLRLALRLEPIQAPGRIDHPQLPGTPVAEIGTGQLLRLYGKRQAEQHSQQDTQ